MRDKDQNRTLKILPADSIAIFHKKEIKNRVSPSPPAPPPEAEAAGLWPNAPTEELAEVEEQTVLAEGRTGIRPSLPWMSWRIVITPKVWKWKRKNGSLILRENIHCLVSP